MLSYEEELQLSDILVARRSISDALKAEGRNPTRREKAAIKQGDEAATVLVEHYVPLIRKIASSVLSKVKDESLASFKSYGERPVTFDDLVSEGTIAALSCCNSFNARGTGDFPGKRFSSYASMAISKAMNRYIAKMSTPLKMDISVIQRSWQWMAVRDDLETKLRRPPTDEEVETQIGVSAEDVRLDIPHHSGIRDIDDPEAYNDPGSDPVIDLISEIDATNAILSEVLTTYVTDEFYNAYMVYLGLDLGYPRTIKETAAEIGATQKWTKEMIDGVNDLVRHPMYRTRMATKLKEMGWKPSYDA